MGDEAEFYSHGVIPASHTLSTDSEVIGQGVFVLLYPPRREDGAGAQQTGVLGSAASHQLVRAHVAALRVPPVPVGDGEARIPAEHADLALPVQQVDAVPRQEARSPVSEVHVGPHVPRPAEQRVPGHVVVHPHEHVVHGHVGEHRRGAVAHLAVGARGHDVVPAGGLLGQVQVGHQPRPLGPGQVQNVPPQRLPPLVAARPEVAELALGAVEAHEVAHALAGAVVEHQRPLFPVVQPGEGILGPVRFIRHLHVLAEAPAGSGSARRAVSIPGRAALLGAQRLRSGARPRKLLVAGRQA